MAQASGNGASGILLAHRGVVVPSEEGEALEERWRRSLAHQHRDVLTPHPR
jgi:hypothetical protein